MAILHAAPAQSTPESWTDHLVHLYREQQKVRTGRTPSLQTATQFIRRAQ